MKKKVIYLFTSCKNRGPTKQTLNIIKYLDRDVYEPILVTLYKNDANDSLLSEYLQEVEQHYALDSSLKRIMLGRTQKINKIFDELEVGIIHSIGLVPAHVAQKYGKCIHFTTIRNFIYDDYITKFGKLTGSLMAKMTLSIIKKSPHVYTCSESLSLLYKERLDMELPFIRNGVDIKNFSPKNNKNNEGLKIKLGLPLDKKILIYTGQFIARKDQKFAIEGFLLSEASRSACLLLLGEGVNYQQLFEKYNNHDNIIFAGNVVNVSEYLQVADIYLSTSKSEGLPNGVLEAMATGLPVLLSDIPQHKEIYEINPEIGLLYELSNQSDFSNKLDEAINSNLEAMGEESYLTVKEELNAELMSKKYQEEYQKALLRKRD